MNKKPNTNHSPIPYYSLTIGWLYPDLMSIYGDRGNIIVLQKRCEWRGINVKVQPISLTSTNKEITSCNILFGGGAQDSQQTVVFNDLQRQKGEILKKMIESGIPGLFICGAYQFLGKYYKEADGTIIPGLNIFDLHTENHGPNHPRLIGNVIAKLNQSIYTSRKTELSHTTIVGFENHGGRTYLGKEIKPLGQIIKGYGNNGQDQTEGAIYKNSVGSYFHGPILPKNPFLADWLIQKALEKKYGKEIPLKTLNDKLAEKAHQDFARK